MRYIYNFKHLLFLEKLHINKDIENLSTYIYNNFSKIQIGKYTIDNSIPPRLNIKKIILNITTFNGKTNAMFNIKKSFKDKNGNWIMILDIVYNFTYETIFHEVNHMYELTRMGKNNFYEKNILKERKVRNNFFHKLKRIYNDLFNDYYYPTIYLEIKEKYNPKRNLNYYNNFFKKQADKLEKRLYSLYDHFI